MATSRPYADSNIDTAAVTRPGSGISHLDWGAIIAGAVLAAAISFVLLSFGAAIGLSVASPYRGEGVSRNMILIAIALWMVWVIVSSFMAGGYLAGRMRRTIGDATPHEVEVRDGAHGLMVWALGVLIAALLTASGISGLARTGAVAGAAAAASGSGDRFGGTGPVGLAVDSLFRPAGPAAPGGAAANATPAAPGGAAPPAASSGGTGATGGAPGAATNPAELRESKQEVGRILASTTLQGNLSNGDRAYIVRLVAERTGMPEAQADRRVTEVLAEARHAADQTRQAGVIAGFVTAASLLVGAAGAWWAAGNGGRHRDENTVFAGFFRRRR